MEGRGRAGEDEAWEDEAWEDAAGEDEAAIRPEGQRRRLYLFLMSPIIFVNPIRARTLRIFLCNAIRDHRRSPLPSMAKSLPVLLMNDG